MMLEKDIYLIHLMLELILARKENTLCPDNWVESAVVGMGCLMFNSTKPLTWLEANSYCQSEADGISVEIQTKEQLDFVISQLQLLEEHTGAHYWWTGGLDIGREGAWFWASTLTPVEDFIWHPGFPRLQNTAYNCMILHSSLGYKALDEPCGTYEAYPLCQKTK